MMLRNHPVTCYVTQKAACCPANFKFRVHSERKKKQKYLNYCDQACLNKRKNQMSRLKQVNFVEKIESTLGR